MREEGSIQLHRLVRRFLVTLLIIFPVTSIPVLALIATGKVKIKTLLSPPIGSLFVSNSWIIDLARVNLYISIIILTFAIVDVFSWALGKFFKGTQFLQTRKYFLISIMLAWAMFLGAIMLYNSSLLTDLSTVQSYIKERPKTTGTAGTTTGSAKMALTMFYLGERLIIGLMVILFALSLERWMIEKLRANFQSASSYRQLIASVNEKYALLTRVYQRLLRLGRHTFFSPNLTIQYKSLDMSILELLITQDDPYLPTDVNVAVDDLFRSMSLGEDGEINKEALESTRRLNDHDISELMKWLSEDDTITPIGRAQVYQKIHQLYEERLQCRHRLQAIKYILGRLHGILQIAFVLLGASLASPIFDFGAGKIWATYGLLAGSLGFIFKGAAHTAFEALMLIFVRHPFDIGDQVLIDGTKLIVDNVQVFTTRFLKPEPPKQQQQGEEGQKALPPSSSISTTPSYIIWYIPNSRLMDKTIVNLTRSANLLK